jgi:hypothetical protein
MGVVRTTDRHAPPALTEAVHQLYRACHLAVPTTIVAADMVSFFVEHAPLPLWAKK